MPCSASTSTTRQSANERVHAAGLGHRLPSAARVAATWAGSASAPTIRIPAAAAPASTSPDPLRICKLPRTSTTVTSSHRRHSRASAVGLLDCQVAGFLELAQVRAEAAVRLVERSDGTVQRSSLPDAPAAREGPFVPGVRVFPGERAAVRRLLPAPVHALPERAGRPARRRCSRGPGDRRRRARHRPAPCRTGHYTLPSRVSAA